MALIEFNKGADQLAFGERGLRVLTSTSLTNEKFAVLHIIEDCVFTADCNTPGGDSSISLTLTAGNVIYGVFDNINITSGSIIGYIKQK